jgi:hypothetical protein
MLLKGEPARIHPPLGPSIVASVVVWEPLESPIFESSRRQAGQPALSRITMNRSFGVGCLEAPAWLVQRSLVSEGRTSGRGGGGTGSAASARNLSPIRSSTGPDDVD